MVKEQIYKGEDCISRLMDLLRSWSDWCFTERRKFKQLKISTDDGNILKERDEIVCCLCGKIVEHNLRVIHHCHVTGQMFGVAHCKCNLRAKTTRFLPVFHNLSRYDAHHIINYLKLNDGEKLSAIAKNDKTYIYFSLDIPMDRFKSKLGLNVVLYHSLLFLDSFQFISERLDSLAKTVDKNDFKLRRAGFPNIGDDFFQRLNKKGFFPYNYLD